MSEPYGPYWKGLKHMPSSCRKKKKQNRYNASFKLKVIDLAIEKYIFAACVWIEIFFSFRGCGLYACALNKPKFTLFFPGSFEYIERL